MSHFRGNQNHSEAVKQLARVLLDQTHTPFEEALEFAARCVNELSRAPGEITEEELLEWFDAQAGIGEPVESEIDEAALQQSLRDIEEGRIEEV